MHNNLPPNTMAERNKKKDRNEDRNKGQNSRRKARKRDRQSQQSAVAEVPLQKPSKTAPASIKGNNPFESLAEISQDRFNNLDNAGAFGGIRQSPHNRGGRLNNPLGAPEPGESYLRSPEDQQANIAARQSNFANPQELMANAQNAIQERKDERAAPEWTPGPNDFVGGQELNPQFTSYEAGGIPFDKPLGVTPQAAPAPQPAQVAQQPAPAPAPQQPNVQQDIQSLISSNQDPTSQIDMGLDNGQISPDQGSEYMSQWRANDGVGMDNPIWQRMVEQGRQENLDMEAQVNAPIPNPFTTPGNEYMNQDGLDGIVPSVVNAADQGLAQILDLFLPTLLGPQTPDYTQNADLRTQQRRRDQFN